MLTISQQQKLKKTTPRKKIYVWSNYYKSNQSTIHLFIECKVNFSSQIKDKMLEGRNLLNPQMPGVSLWLRRAKIIILN